MRMTRRFRGGLEATPARTTRNRKLARFSSRVRKHPVRLDWPWHVPRRMRMTRRFRGGLEATPARTTRNRKLARFSSRRREPPATFPTMARATTGNVTARFRGRLERRKEAPPDRTGNSFR